MKEMNLLMIFRSSQISSLLAGLVEGGGARQEKNKCDVTHCITEIGDTAEISIYLGVSGSHSLGFEQRCQAL